MSADASQQSLSLGWFLLLAVPAVIACVWAWLASGSETVDRALADLPTDDEPAPYLPTECTDPGCDCEKAREVARANLRAFQRSQWVESLRAVARADAEAVQR